MNGVQFENLSREKKAEAWGWLPFLLYKISISIIEINKSVEEVEDKLKQV